MLGRKEMKRKKIHSGLAKRVKAMALTGVMALSLMATPVASRRVQAANGTAAELVGLAASQVGYHEKASNAYLDDFTANSGSNNYNKYARDIGVANGYAWCATFVWWLMRSASVPDSAYPSRTTVTRDWFNQRGLYRARGTYTPKQGDYVIFGNVAHCGIVESVSGGNVTTIEGNCSDQVKRNTYAMTNSYILGYGIINYNSSSGGNTSTGISQTDNPGSPYPIPSGNLRSGSRGNDVRWIQQFANDVMGAGIAVDGIYGNQTTYAVRVFQQNNGLTVDGICGAQTTAKMLAVWRNKVKERDQAKHNPVGCFDLAEGTADGKLHVRGWMYDPDAVTKSNVVHVYIGGPAGTAGAEGHAITANASRPDVDNAYHVGQYHGFDAVITTQKTGNQAVYVYGINEGAGTTNPEIGHKTVNIPVPKKECEHVFTKYVSNNDATCGNDGTETAVCDKCHEKKNTRTDEGSATGEHKWDEGTVVREATEKETGMMKYICQVCGEVRYEEIPVVEKVKETTEIPETEDKKTTEEKTTETSEIEDKKTTEEKTSEASTVEDKKTEEKISEASTVEDKKTEEKTTEVTTAEDKTAEENTIEVTVAEDKKTEENTTEVMYEEDKKVEENITEVMDEEDKKAEENTTGVPTTEDKMTEEKAADNNPIAKNAGETMAAVDRNSEDFLWETDNEVEIDAPVIKKISNIKKRSIKIKAAKDSSIDGYEYNVVCVTNSSLKKLKKKVVMSDGDKVSFKGMRTYNSRSNSIKLSGLKKGRKYAVVIRAYKTVEGTKIYSDYSDVRSVKI